MKRGAEFSPGPTQNAQDRPKPSWWGVTIGSLTYAVRAKDAASAKRLTFQTLAVPQKGNVVPTIIERHPDEFQGKLTERYGARQQVVRVINFSMDKWPTSEGPRVRKRARKHRA